MPGRHRTGARVLGPVNTVGSPLTLTVDARRTAAAAITNQHQCLPLKSRQRDWCSSSGSTRSQQSAIDRPIAAKAAVSPRLPSRRQGRTDLTPTALSPGSPEQRRCVPAPRTDPRPAAAPTCLCGARRRANRTALLVIDHWGALPVRDAPGGCWSAFTTSPLLLCVGSSVGSPGGTGRASYLIGVSGCRVSKCLGRLVG